MFFPDPLTVNSHSPDCLYRGDRPSVAFDSRGDVYVLTLQTSGAADGALMLTEFNFSGNTPSEGHSP